MIDSRASRDGTSIRRRRQCLKCGHRFTTYECVETRELLVIKRDGRREPFSKEKLRNGILKACQKRPLTHEVIDEVVDRITTELHEQYDREVPCVVIGEKVMDELRALDPVAYVRFVSVYRRFEEPTDFVLAVKRLEVPRDTATFRLPGF